MPSDPPLFRGLVALRKMLDEFVDALDRPEIGGVARHALPLKASGSTARALDGRNVRRLSSEKS
jgi:hypothetical protein